MIVNPNPASAGTDPQKRLAGIIAEVDHSTRRLANRLRGKNGIDLIGRPALTCENERGPAFQEGSLAARRAGMS